MARQLVDGPDALARDLVDNRVDRPHALRLRFSQPEGADRIEGPEIASRTIVPPPVASGASLPLTSGRLTAIVRGVVPGGM